MYQESMHENLCRLCLRTSQTMEDIFSPEKLYTTMVEELIGLKIVNEANLPHLICNTCVGKLDKLGTFRSICWRTEEFLRDNLLNLAKDTEITVIEIVDFDENESLTVSGEDEAQNESLEFQRNVGPVRKYERAKRKFAKIKENKQEDPTTNGLAEEVESLTDLDRSIRNFEGIGKTAEAATGLDLDSVINAKVCETNSYVEVAIIHEEVELQNNIDMNQRKVETKVVNEDVVEPHENKTTPKGRREARSDITCHICGKLFGSNRFKYHINTHNNVRPFVCQIEDCQKAFPSPFQLSSHQKICHTDTYPYKCDICERLFKVKTSYVVHRSYHFDPELPCSVCGKLLRNQRALKKHMMSHTGERPFPCDRCSKSFQNRYNLKIHQRVHTKEKPFLCMKCGDSFGYNCILKAHIQKHHPNNIGES